MSFQIVHMEKIFLRDYRTECQHPKTGHLKINISYLILLVTNILLKNMNKIRRLQEKSH